MNEKDSILKRLINIYAAPGEVYPAIRERGMWWVPFTLLVSAGCALYIYYFYSFVDFPWLADQLLQADATDADPEQIELARKFITKNSMTISLLTTTLLGTPIIFLIQSVYLHLVDKGTGGDMGIGKWFALVNWTSMPAFLSVILSFITMFLNDNGQLNLSGLSPANLDNLVFHLANDHTWKGMVASINLFTVWGVILLALGFKAWTKRSTFSAFAWVLAPYAVILAGWSVINLLS